MTERHKENDETRRQRELDLAVYGMFITSTRFRTWYNPMRWIKGREYTKRICPKYIYWEVSEFDGVMK